MVERTEHLRETLVGVYTRTWSIVVLMCLAVPQLLLAEETSKHTSMFVQDWLKTLVSIEVWEPNEPNKPVKTPKPVGSGFLVETPNDNLVLITAKHVVFEKEDEWKQRPHLAYRINRKDKRSDLFRESLVASYLPEGWFKSDRHDVACRRMIRRRGLSDYKTLTYSLFLTKSEIEPGAPLIVVGFPLGLRSEEYALPILRRGMVARADPNNILIDAFIFPGNSGGPVIYAPTFLTSRMLRKQRLVGLVSGYVPYVDRAISSQTKRTRITFEENSGLSRVVPVSAILELLKSPEFAAVDTKIR